MFEEHLKGLGKGFSSMVRSENTYHLKNEKAVQCALGARSGSMSGSIRGPMGEGRLYGGRRRENSQGKDLGGFN